MNTEKVWLWQNLLAIIIGKKDDKYIILL